MSEANPGIKVVAKLNRLLSDELKKFLFDI
jgi:hypothetical protein